MAKDPTQGPVSTYDAEGNPIKTNVSPPTEDVVEETAEEEVVEEAEDAPEIADSFNQTGEDIDFRVESAPEEEAPEDAEEVVTPPDLPDDYVGGTEPVESAGDEDVDEPEEEAAEEAPDAEEPSDIKDEITKERVSDEFGNPVDEDEYAEHPHDVKAPLSYGEAETLLKDTPFLKLREIAIADGLKPERSKKKLMQQLLAIWFAPSEAPKTEEEQHEMSVRIRRIKGLM